MIGIAVWMVVAIFSGDAGPSSSRTPAPQTPEQVRAKRIERGFSAWDGSHVGLTQTIKSAMNDPGSYEHVETRYSDKGDHLLVMTTFRGKNAFGGVVKNTWIAKADLDGKVLELVSTGQ